MRRYLDILDAFAGLRVGVVGDFLLDQYLLGKTSRVSREAPIVVVDYLDTVYHPGGAANAAQNVAALGASALAVGVLGKDDEGGVLCDLLASRGVDTTGLLRVEGAATSNKMRILAGEMNAQKQQVARVDRSHPVALDSEGRRALHAQIDRLASACGALLLADYGLGVLSNESAAYAVAACRRAGIAAIVDSRYRLTAFTGATVATPNEVEALSALQLEDEAALTDAAVMRRAVKSAGLESIIVTRGTQGMVILDRDGELTTIGITGNTAATDVTGAGDTVSASVALSLAAGASVVEAARMATFAASVVVMKRGTATASPEEVRAAIAADGAGR